MKKIKRRDFLKSLAYTGAGMSYLTFFNNNLLSADVLKEEEKKEKLAKYVFNLGAVRLIQNSIFKKVIKTDT